MNGAGRIKSEELREKQYKEESRREFGEKVEVE